MNYATPRLRRDVMRLLAHEAGGGAANSAALAAAAGRLLDRLTERLSVVIAGAGVEAIFRRAVMLRKPGVPFLDEGLFSRAKDESIGDALRARLQGQGPDVVREVSVTLLATMAGLLVTVIGERLAWSLLREIWPEALRVEVELQETGE